VRYVDAGYTICLAVLFFYSISLVLRHRRLSRAVSVAETDRTEDATETVPEEDR